MTTRRGGTSVAPYESMNCALHVGDVEQSVIENRRILARKLQFSIDDWTCADQVHGDQIAIVTDKERGRGGKSLADALPNADGLITKERNALLAAFFADCVPIYFLEPTQSIIGIAHAGWRGTARNIAARMVELFKRRYNADARQLLVAIGPSIGRCCYEVDESVVIATHAQLPSSSRFVCAKEKGDGKFLLDLKKANRLLLERAGVPARSIVASDYCVCCENELFFSYRKEAGKTGRMTAFIGFHKKG